jgi:hypothetical protein
VTSGVEIVVRRSVELATQLTTDPRVTAAIVRAYAELSTESLRVAATPAGQQGIGVPGNGAAGGLRLLEAAPAGAAAVPAACGVTAALAAAGPVLTRLSLELNLLVADMVMLFEEDDGDLFLRPLQAEQLASARFRAQQQLAVLVCLASSAGRRREETRRSIKDRCRQIGVLDCNFSKALLETPLVVTGRMAADVIALPVDRIVTARPFVADVCNRAQAHAFAERRPVIPITGSHRAG